MKKESQSNKSSLTIYVVFSITMLLIYTIVEQIISIKTGISHDTLTTCFFAAFGLENVLCAVIKISKVKHQDEEEEEDEYELDNQ